VADQIAVAVDGRAQAGDAVQVDGHLEVGVEAAGASSSRPFRVSDPPSFAPSCPATLAFDASPVPIPQSVSPCPCSSALEV
jgi:hypothetical protein